MALALASQNQSFANLADMFQGQQNLSDGGESSRRVIGKQRLLNGFIQDPALLPAKRGSSLFIKRVADLEGSEKRVESAAADPQSPVLAPQSIEMARIIEEER